MKKLLCIILSVILIFGTFVFSVNAVETTKISQDLADELQNGSSDTVSVYIWLKEIISESEVERIVAEKYTWTDEQEHLKLYRQELKNIVEPYVQRFIDDNALLLDNIKYQGKTVTFIIADVKRENIANLAESDTVTQLSLYKDEVIEPDYDEENTKEPTTGFDDIEQGIIPTDGGPEYSEIMRKKVSEASIYSNIESDKIEIQIKDSSEGMAYAEDYHENGGKKLLEDFKDYGIISIENCYIDFAYYRAFVTLDKKDRKNVIDTCLELFDNPLVIAATPVTTHGEVRFEKGDVNADEALDIIDAVNIQKFTVDRIGFRDEQKSFGDYNNDGICDILDSTAIQKALVAE